MSNSVPDSKLVEELLTNAGETGLAVRVNKQDIRTNLKAQELQKEYEESPDALFGDKRPNLVIKSERPEHRMIVYLKAQGMTNQEIANKTGYGYQWVCQIVRQPWFRAKFVEECKEVGRDAVETFLKAEVLPSLETLRNIRDNEAGKAADRRAAADSLLDRFLGKPTQRVEKEETSKGLDAARETVEDLERQLVSLRQQNGLADSLPPQS